MMFATFRLLTALVVLGMAGGNGLGGLDSLLPCLDDLSFSGLQVNDLLDCNFGNWNFGLLAAFRLLAFLFAALRLLAFALLFAFAFCLFLAAFRLCFAALRLLAALGLFALLFAALLLFAFALAAALLLQGNDNLGGLHQLGANDLAAFNYECLGAYGLGIESLCILDNNGGNLIGSGDNGGNFLLSTTAGSGNHCSANCANK